MNDSMKIDGAGSLGTATTINKIEELPYEGKPLGSPSATDRQGMKVEGDSMGKGDRSIAE